MTVINSPELIAAFEAELQQLVGLKCWSIIAGYPSGSMADINFGLKVPRDYLVTNTSLSMDERFFEGEVILFVQHCPWRIENREQIIGSWNDDNRVGGPMLAALDQMIGKRVERVELLRPGLDLIIIFSEGYVFRLFCDQTNDEEDYTNYTYLGRENKYAVTTRSKLSIYGKRR